MALLLWFHVATDKTYEYSERFPLEITNVPEQLLLAEKLPQQVNVTIRGKGKDLLKLMMAETKSVKIEAKEFTRGETDYVIRPEGIPIPEGLELRVTAVLPPKNLKVRLDYPMEKELKVQPNVTVMPAEGFEQVGDLHYNPREVSISGPRMWVRNLKVIHTEEKVIEGASEPISEQIDLILPEGYNLSLSEQKVSYSVNLERVVERDFRGLAVEAIRVPRGGEVILEPDSISVTVSGVQSLISQMSPDSIRVTVDCAAASRKDTVKFPILVQLPAQVKLMKTEPDSAAAFIR